MMRLEEREKLLEAINRDLNRTNRQIAFFRLARIITITLQPSTEKIIKVMKS